MSGRARLGLGSDGDVSLLPVVSLQVKSERWLGALFNLLLRLGLSASAIGRFLLSFRWILASQALLAALMHCSNALTPPPIVARGQMQL